MSVKVMYNIEPFFVDRCPSKVECAFRVKLCNFTSLLCIKWFVNASICNFVYMEERNKRFFYPRTP